MGRTSLLLVIAFNITFMMMGYRLSTATSTAFEKYYAYSNIEQAGLALEGAANVAISFALLNPAPVAADTFLCHNDPFHQGTFTIHVFRLLTSDGDSISITGSYPIAGCYTALGVQDSIRLVTSVRVRGNAFAQYVFYSQNEQSIQWQTGEICRGRLHTQDKLYIDGTPDFKGKVTTKGGVSIVSGTPNFEQGSSYADISIPSDLTDLKKYGATTAGGKLYDGLDVYVELLSNGSVTVRTAPANTGTNANSSTTAVNVWNYAANSTLVNSSYSGGTPAPMCTTYASIAALTSSGVLLVENGELHVKGTLNGQITLGCVDTSKIVSGNPVNSGLSSVWIDGSITYNQPPPCSQYPGRSSDDMLGIVATNNILVSQYANHDNTTTTSHGHTTNDGTELTEVTIDASMFSQAGGFGAENYSGRGSDGTLHIVGGVQQKTRNAVGTNFGATGFLKDYDWDNNLQTMQPKGYPKTPFTIQSWVDNTTIPNSFFE